MSGNPAGLASTFGKKIDVKALPKATRYVGQVSEVVDGNPMMDFIYLGGTHVLTDEAGLVREMTDYDPYGVIIRHERYGNDDATAWYYFTGKALDDETGLMYYGARYYNPKLGRFITPDTIVGYPGDPQSFNRYSYCHNNPVNLIDPSGHKSFWKKAGDFFKQFGGTIISVAFTFIGMPFIGALVSSAFNTIVNRGSFGDFAMSFGVGLATGYAGGYVAGGVARSMGMNMSGLGTAVFRGVLGGAISGAGTAAIFGGDIGRGALIGAGMGAAMGAAIWKMNDMTTNKLLAKVKFDGFTNKEQDRFIQGLRELGQSPMGQREFAAILADSHDFTISAHPDVMTFLAHSEDYKMGFYERDNIKYYQTKEPGIYAQHVDWATVLGHEMGHTMPVGHNMTDPLNVSFHENPYRSWTGQHSVETYRGESVSFHQWIYQY